MEKNYSTTDRESLAIMFALDKFHQFIYGHKFTLLTDHKPLERIFGNKSNQNQIISGRLTRWALKLSAYDYEIKYRRSSELPVADSLSRLCQIEQSISQTQDFKDLPFQVNFILEIPKFNKRAIQIKIQNDQTLSKVIRNISVGWPERKLIDHELIPYYDKRDSICMMEGLLLWNDRIVIPRDLRNTFLEYLHIGHPGMESMIGTAKSYVWCPKLKVDAINWVKKCYECQSLQPKQQETPIYPWPISDSPWERLHIDYTGPVNNKWWFLIMDAHSKWIEVFMFKESNTGNTLRALKQTFARFGIPRIIVSDNGRQFTSKEFSSFCSIHGIKHVKSTPYHSRSNGQAERGIRIIKENFKKLNNFENDEDRMQIALYSYRNSINKSTIRCPSELLFGRKLRSSFDNIKPSVKANEEFSKTKFSIYHDKNKKYKEFKINENVWVKNEIQ